MIKKLVIILGMLGIAANVFAYPTPRPTSNFIASMDVLPTSSDTHSVGATSNFFRNGYFRNVYLPYRGEAPGTIASRGVIFASTDGHVYFRNAAGTTTKLS